MLNTFRDTKTPENACSINKVQTKQLYKTKHLRQASGAHITTDTKTVAIGQQTLKWISCNKSFWICAASWGQSSCKLQLACTTQSVNAHHANSSSHFQENRQTLGVHQAFNVQYDFFISIQLRTDTWKRLWKLRWTLKEYLRDLLQFACFTSFVFRLLLFRNSKQRWNRPLSFSRVTPKIIMLVIVQSLYWEISFDKNYHLTRHSILDTAFHPPSAFTTTP